MGGQVDNSINNGKDLYVYCLNGQNYHQIGSLLPPPNSRPSFAQLYVYDTKNEISNWAQCMRETGSGDGIDTGIVPGLHNMSNDYNPYVRSFQMARDRIDSMTTQ